MSAPGNDSCPFCKLPLRDYHDYVTCPECQTSFHEKCWEENNGCTLCNLRATPESEISATTLSWFLYHSNRNLGPLTWEELCSHPAIQPDDLVWNNSMPTWVRAAEIPNLLPKDTLADEPAERENQAGKNNIDAVLPVKEKEPAAAPPSPEGRKGQEPDGTLETSGTEAIEKRAFDVVEKSAAATPLETDTAPKEKPGGADRSVSSPLVTEPNKERTIPDRHPSRAEQIVGQLYGDQLSHTSPETSFLEREEEYYYEEEPVLDRKFAGPVIAGILLILGGGAATAAAYFHTVGWDNLYHIAAIALAGAVTLLGVVNLFRGISLWRKNRSQESPSEND
ncbi:MAG: DUF4339 domain-containing protein [Firmicutes bacterium]|nr:DUF4339 domain-containing protein [Bacillota bacterium]